MQLYFSTLGFRYFEFRFIYERIPNRIRIRIFGIFVLALQYIQLIVYCILEGLTDSIQICMINDKGIKTVILLVPFLPRVQNNE